MPHKVEVWDGIVMDYQNNARGQALRAIFRVLQARGEDERRWQLVEQMALQASELLRVAALHELTFLANVDKLDRSWQAYEQICAGAPTVLHCGYSRLFLSWIVYHRPVEAEPLVRLLMSDPEEHIAKQGARIAGIMALRLGAIRNDLLEELLNGPTTWGCAIAELVAESTTESLTTDVRKSCSTILESCFGSTSSDIRSEAARFCFGLREEHLLLIKPTLEKFVISPAFQAGDHWFSTFLFEHGSLEPEWTIEQIEIIVNRDIAGENLLDGLGTEELVRCVLRLYALPEMRGDNAFRSRCIDLFGDLLERTSGSAAQTLQEWDEGRFF